MPRYAIRLAYNGKPFHGWQHQENAPSVQDEIESMLQKLLGRNTPVVGCGRTDAGVHAKVFYLHFDAPEIPDNLLFKLNRMRVHQLAFFAVYLVPDDFHARFHATRRKYEYVIQRRPNPFNAELAWHYSGLLHLEEMQKAAELLMTYTDFESFSRVNTDVATFLCKVDESRFTASDEQLIYTISADRFLRNMVRAIVGTLMDVGRGKKTLTDFTHILASKSRSLAGESAPAHGLYLTDVTYPTDDWELLQSI